MKKSTILGIIIAILIIGLVGTYLWFHFQEPKDNSLDTQKTNEIKENLNVSNDNILIAYYSYTGNTKEMAEEIQNQTGGDLFEIKRAEDYDDLYTEAEEEINNNTRPKLADEVDNMDQYDVIFIGYPIWWDMPPAMINSFLESYDLQGKVIIPFCTSSSDGIENSMKSIRSSSKDAAVLEGLRLSSGSATNESGKQEIKDWLDGLGIFNERDS